MDCNDAVASVVRLLDSGRIRIGNECYARSNRSFGATTLLQRHAKVSGQRLTLRFRAKSGKLCALNVTDRGLIRFVKRIHALLAHACDNHLMLATAESCTGGLIGALLTDVEGMSHAYERGFIVYTDEAKAALLGVPHSLIEMHGAVSREVALAMAITGFTGAGAAGDEPGLVYLTCQRRDGPPNCQEAHFGDIGRAAMAAF